MKPWELLGEASTPDGHEMRLIARDGEFVILLDGKTLMSSRLQGPKRNWLWPRARPFPIAGNQLFSWADWAWALPCALP